MGRDKARLPFHGGHLAEFVARTVESAAGSAVLVGDPGLYGEFGYPCPRIGNPHSSGSVAPQSSNRGHRLSALFGLQEAPPRTLSDFAPAGIVNLAARGMLGVWWRGGSGRKVLCSPIVLPALTERGQKKAT